MGALDVELESLQQRLAGKPHNAETLTRRIGEVEAAIRAEAKSDPVAVPETTEADHGAVEAAMLPKAKRK